MINDLKIENFLSLKSVSIELRERNVLVGPNLSGKSNLIRGLRFLTQMVSPQPGLYGLPNAYDSLGGFSEVEWKGSEPGPIGISLKGSGEPFAKFGNGVKWEYSIVIAGSQARTMRVHEESLLVEAGGRRHALIGNDGGDRKFSTLDGLSISTVGRSDRSALEYEIPDWEGNALRRFFSSMRFYQLIPQTMRAANPSAAAVFLTEFGGNLSSWLMTLQTKHSASFDKIARVARDVFPSLQRLFTIPTQQGQVFLASQEQYLTRPTPLSQMSDGELAFIALLSLIFGPPELTSLLYCVEEPENYLHPRLLVTLVEVLKQAQEGSPPEQRAQILLTTHSPYLIDKFSLDELIVFEKREGATVTIRPSDKAHLQDLLQNEDVGLGELFYSGALSGE